MNKRLIRQYSDHSSSATNLGNLLKAALDDHKLNLSQELMHTNSEKPNFLLTCSYSHILNNTFRSVKAQL
jgi:hypothetical protein